VTTTTPASTNNKTIKVKRLKENKFCVFFFFLFGFCFVVGLFLKCFIQGKFFYH